MIIYKLVHETWNNRQISDFELPRILGHFMDEKKAEVIRTAHSLRMLTEKANEGLFTTQVDYNVVSISVTE